MLRVIEKLDSLTTKERRFVYGVDENYEKIVLFINENCVMKKRLISGERVWIIFKLTLMCDTVAIF